MNKPYFASFASVCAVTSVLISSPAWASHFVRLEQVDPAPYIPLPEGSLDSFQKRLVRSHFGDLVDRVSIEIIAQSSSNVRWRTLASPAAATKIREVCDRLK